MIIMNPLVQNLEHNETYQEIIQQIKKGAPDLSVMGLTDSGKALSIYAMTKLTQKSSIVICSNNAMANKVMQDLKFYSDLEVVYFPARSLVYYDIEAESKEVENQRMYAINKILEGKLQIVVTTIDAALVKMLPRVHYQGQDVVLKVGDRISLTDTIEKLANLGYERCETVEGKGQFAVRGGILDIFGIENELPCRIELFGDDIDNIRTFDALTQRSIDTIKKVEISFVSEHHISQTRLYKGIENLKELADSTHVTPELRENILEDIEKQENGHLENLFDKYFEVFADKSTSLLEYVSDYTVIWDEPSKCMEKAASVCYENVETLKILAEREYIYVPYANKYMGFEEVLAYTKHMPCVYMERLTMDKNIHKGRKCFSFDTKEMSFYKNGMDVLLQDVKRAQDKNIVLVFPTKVRTEQVKNYLLDNHVKVEYIEDLSMLKQMAKGKVYITHGILSSGMYSDAFSLMMIVETVSGVKSTKIKKIKKNTVGQSINSYEDLAEGDYIVHENHGIGIYRGIETIAVQSVRKDYIKLEYSDKGTLYVPINQLDSVRKYVCDDDTVPKLNSLGTKEWERTKYKVASHVKEIAKELMLLYAKREKMQGYAFPPDTPWQKEFEDSFAYELTEDQKQAVMEVKQDMESIKPMDRLLCGDVGYGKTEVALRAAFKAAVNSKQVAYMVPTTVLSLQQYRTFKERMEPFGIRVEMLSRFKSAKEQKQILKDLVDGKIDIIVGTHRLLSKDVFFKDLGLLIIDEEHRFGVKAKETLKQLRETVDVLSMTATPIPRTLHMSMIGIREMSTLTEPPMERLPVHTYVLEYDENIMKEAIEKELLRDGQIFYINNRVNNIEEVTEKVRGLVPQARVAFAHGQMSPDQIEDIMLRFMDHELDLIVCTTILESGIDIRNANTIIIENADKLGLAQLYQIRGRVGRSSRLAYAYVTYEKNKQLSEVSEKRLKAIKDFTEFGSGFKIALRDLEIRGAGNLLGREQHGHMAKVGYDLYLALLEKAIQEEKNGVEKNGKDEVQKEVKIDIPVSAYISDNYIRDPIQKIAMYQKISDIETKEQSMEVIDELLDRFGDLPKETENLIKIVEIRNAARMLGITRIAQVGEFLKFEPGNLKYRLTNVQNNDILLHVQIEIKKLEKLLKEKG